MVVDSGDLIFYSGPSSYSSRSANDVGVINTITTGSTITSLSSVSDGYTSVGNLEYESICSMCGQYHASINSPWVGRCARCRSNSVSYHGSVRNIGSRSSVSNIGSSSSVSVSVKRNRVLNLL